jgi:hypothetical protein
VTGTATAELTISGRFNGPDRTANGGYVCGLLAGRLGSRAAVALHAPPPLDVPLRVTADRGRTHLWHENEVLASAVPATRPIGVVPAPVPTPTAVAAGRHYEGRRRHPFPTCFVCGVRRTAGDGLNLTPGEVPGRAATVACVWSPEESVATDGAVTSAVVWGVLDCPSGWAAGPMPTPRVLVWMTAEILRLPAVGTEYVVVAESTGEGGSSSFGGVSALYGPGDDLVAHAASRWLVLA